MMLLDKQRVKENIEKRLSEDISSGRVGGASVLVKQNGEVIYKNVFGRASEHSPITEDSMFRLASMTKPSTAVAIMRQVEKGLVSLDDDLDRFIPRYGEMDIAVMENNEPKIIKKAENKIKILHLLSHSSGVGCGAVGDYLNIHANRNAEIDLKGVSEEYASKPLTFEPYTAQAYSPRVGFDLLARVVEITSGMPYDEFLKKELFEPLEMCDTTFRPTAEQWSRTVTMHRFDGGVVSFEPVDDQHIFGGLPLEYFCGGAGLVSSVADYEKFAEMLLNDGIGANGARILSKDSVDLLRTPSIPESIMPGNQRWGLGMRVITAPSYGRLPVGCFGWSGAYGAHVWVDPENKILGIYMKNSRYDGGSGAVTAANFEKDVYL